MMLTERPSARHDVQIAPPPCGFENWREVYALLLSSIAYDEGGALPWGATIRFRGPNGMPAEVEYWKAEHYASREQAVENAGKGRLGSGKRLWMVCVFIRHLRRYIEPSRWLPWAASMGVAGPDEQPERIVASTGGAPLESWTTPHWR